MKTGIVVFAFGVKGNSSNVRLQSIAVGSVREFQAPIYAQIEMEFPLGVDVEYTQGTLEDPPPTLREARGAVEWAKRRGLTRLMVVAAKPHLPRCLRDLMRASEEANVSLSFFVPEEITQSDEDEWFCLGSVETRVKTKSMWLVRERILILLPFWLYQLVAN